MRRTDAARNPVVIIGGGIAGLAVGSYLRMNGYDTRILEMGSCCGGVCVSWKRKGYTFDGATNWLPGAYPSCNLHGLLAELIDFGRLPLYFGDIFIRVERDGETFTVYKDADRLRGEMLRLAPGDRRHIDRFIAAVKHASTLRVPWEQALEVLGPLGRIGMAARYAPVIAHKLRWGGTTIAEYAEGFRSPALRTLFPGIFPRHGFFSVFGVIMALGWMHARGEGYPYGGSARITGLFEEKYRSLGGEIAFGKRVDRILVSEGRVAGVVCADGSRYEGGIVVSAADSHDTLFRLLPETYLPPALRRRFRDWRVFPSIVQVSLGVARAFDRDEPKSCIPLLQPLAMGSSTVDDMLVRVCSFDPSLAPAGKTPVVVHLRVEDHAYWSGLRDRDPAAYRAEKDRVAAAVTDALDKRYGRIRENVEVVDVATPATIIRYTNTWQGAYQSWAPTPGVVGSLLPKTLPGLRGFYMTGHWLWPGGGIPAAVRISRDVAQMICARDGAAFRSVSAATPEMEHG